MPVEYFAGSWCDVTATPTGYAFVRILDDGSAICTDHTGATLWTAPLPVGVTGTPRFVRCACDALGEVKAIATIETTGNIDRAFWIEDGAMTSTTVATFGERAVLVRVVAGVFTATIALSGTTYATLPYGGALSAPVANPFPDGTVLGLLQFADDGSLVWAESETDPGTRYTVTFSGVVLQQPNESGGLTVGQLVGPPVTADGIVAAGGSVLANILTVKAFDPHIAALTAPGFSQQYAICARLDTPIDGDSAALLVGKPQSFPNYTGLSSANSGANQPTNDPMVNPGTAFRVTEPWSNYFQAIARSVKRTGAFALQAQEIVMTAVGFGRVAVSGQGTVSADAPNAVLTLTSADGTIVMTTDPVTKTIDFSAAHQQLSWVPLALGTEPLTFVSDGLGQPILVPYEP